MSYLYLHALCTHKVMLCCIFEVITQTSSAFHSYIYIVAWKLWLLAFYFLDFQSNGWSKRAPIHLEFPMEKYLYIHIIFISMKFVSLFFFKFPSQQHFFPRVFLLQFNTHMAVGDELVFVFI
jgi:hypothetical protein